MDKKIIYDLDFDKDSENDMEGVMALSLVYDPAIQSNFITLSSEENKVTLSAIDDEKRLLVGPALIPDMEIIRANGSYIRFSKEVVRKSMENFFIRGNQSNSSHEHDMKESLSGVCVVESWIVEDIDNDKINLYGIDVPEGTWMVAMKCENDEMYQLAKEGKIKGFSIEGVFPERTKVELSKQEFINAVSELDDEGLDMIAEIHSELESIEGVPNGDFVEFIKNLLEDE